MAYQMVATALTLNDLEGHSPVANIFTCNLNPSNICAAFYTISTDVARRALPLQQQSLLSIYTYFRPCGWFSFSSVQRARRLKDEKKKKERIPGKNISPPTYYMSDSVITHQRIDAGRVAFQERSCQLRLWLIARRARSWICNTRAGAELLDL